MYKEHLKNLFEASAITIPDISWRQNLYQAILPHIKEIRKRLWIPDSYKIIYILNPKENETSNAPDLGEIIHTEKQLSRIARKGAQTMK